MGRISGLVATEPSRAHLVKVGNQVTAWHEALGKGSNQPSSNHRFAVLKTDRAQLSWWGWSKPQLLQIGDLLGVLTGWFLSKTASTSASESSIKSVLELYRRYGFAGTLERLNGDFVLAIYDGASGTLWLGRDRLGVKPLYYARGSFQGEPWFAFASRPRPLLLLHGVDTRPNPQYVALFAGSHYRYFDNAPEQSPYLGIAQLPAASYLCYREQQLTIERYWKLSDQPDFTESEFELAARYRNLLLDAVQIRLNAASKPAFTLSGGMDSSSILASAVQLSGNRQNAFSTIYADKTYDESAEIRSMLASCVEQWQPVEIGTPDVWALVEQAIAAHDEPIATATWLSHWLLCQVVAEQGFGSLFGGLGGDELNAGEYEYFWYHFADLRSSGREQDLANEIAAWVTHHDHPIFRKSQAIVEYRLPQLVDFAQPGRCLPDRDRLLRYASALNPDYFDLANFEPVMEQPFASYLKNRTYQDLTRETLPCCLRAEDRQSAAFGLDHFLPFLDYRLVEFAYRVPGSMKIRGGVTKILLREAMRGILPEETRQRIKKTGWNAPAHQWFSGAGRERLHDIVSSQTFRTRGIYNVQEVMRLIDEHEQIVATGKPIENHMMFLWQLLNLEMWLSIPD